MIVDSSSIMLRGYSSVGRAPALQAGGLEFESLYLHKSRNSNHCSDFFCVDIHPSQSPCDSPGLVTAPVGRWGPPYSPDPLRRFARYAHVFLTPSHFVTAPVGHWGPYSPDPLGRYARYAHVFFSTPSHFVTAPMGHWGPDSPAPLSRYARFAHVFFQPPVTS